MRNSLFLIVLFNFIFSIAYSQSITTPLEKLKWDKDMKEYHISKNNKITMWSFEGASNETINMIPVYRKQIPINSNTKEVIVNLISPSFEAFNTFPNKAITAIKSNIIISSDIVKDRGQSYVEISFIPIKKNGSSFEKLTDFRLQVIPTSSNSFIKKSSIATTTPLADGSIYKIATTQTGIYKLDYNYLKNELGVDNLDNINPRNIQLYGNGSGRLPEVANTDNIDNLKEISIRVIGEEDGVFNTNDYILLYAQAADKWIYNIPQQRFLLERQIYDNENHYFIKIGSNLGQRITSQASENITPTYTSNEYNAYQQHELDQYNLLDLSPQSSGGGQQWYGENFRFNTVQDFPFTFPNLITNNSDKIVKVNTYFAAHSVGVASSFTLKIGGQTNTSTLSLGGLTINNQYASRKNTLQSFVPTSENLNMNITFNKGTSTSEGWLDYINVNAFCENIFTGGQMAFRDGNTINEDTRYTLKNASNVNIWDVSDVSNIKNQNTTNNGNTLSFNLSQNANLREFIAFDNTTFLTPEPIGTIANQNLHNLSETDMVIIYHPDFKEAAERLADYRRTHNQFIVEAINVFDIYNEFSAGSEDITAIRNFNKMLYERSNRFKYLLLFGGASFDYKGLDNDITAENLNSNFVPIYYSVNSIHPINSYPTDDYVGLLDDGEGSINSGRLDIGIGRLPVRTLTEANDLVDKIIHYETSPSTFGDWQNRMVFYADDQDNNTHFNDADGIAETVRNTYKNTNIDKVYFDAYRQESASGGTRYPEVQNAISRNVFKGSLTACYLGHGNHDGWADERVLKRTHIEEWNNSDKLPLFITATCTFAPFENYSETSAGELLILKENSGAIGLYTTTRAVYANSNEKLTRSVFNTVFQKENNQYLTIGEILRQAKNNSGADITNSRKFTLLGDPALTLKYPKYKVITTDITTSSNSEIDTLGALEYVTVSGEIHNQSNALLDNFEGVIYPTVYDKVLKTKTLRNDLNSFLDTFNLQKNVIFKGRASVQGGKFEFSFVVPKDINYSFGKGKISYFAHDGNLLDATGYNEDIIVGGTSANVLADDEGPKVEVFMNDDNFAFGGITDENPILLVKLSDDNGINAVGNGIGHDLVGILDDNNQSSYKLNDFYETELNNFRAGTVRFPLSNLQEGRHKIAVTAWDVANNSGEGYTEFVVASSAEVALQQVLNYPNPFTTNTSFQFEHNLPDQPLTVQVQIFTISGRLIKTIQQDVLSEGYLVKNIQWDGRDEYGQRLGRGTYVYKVKIQSNTSDATVRSTESKFKKLVILK